MSGSDGPDDAEEETRVKRISVDGTVETVPASAQPTVDAFLESLGHDPEETLLWREGPSCHAHVVGGPLEAVSGQVFHTAPKPSPGLCGEEHAALADGAVCGVCGYTARLPAAEDPPDTDDVDDVEELTVKVNGDTRALPASFGSTAREFLEFFGYDPETHRLFRVGAAGKGATYDPDGPLVVGNGDAFGTTPDSTLSHPNEGDRVERILEEVDVDADDLVDELEADGEEPATDGGPRAPARGAESDTDRKTPRGRFNLPDGFNS